MKFNHMRRLVMTCVFVVFMLAFGGKVQAPALGLT